LCDLELHLPDVEVGSMRLQEGSPLSGKSLAEIQLRTKYEVTLLAIRRGTQILSNPDGQTKLLADDTLIMLGSPSKLASISGLLQNPSPERDI
jgi:CPA2 family monovalent cation:H+ antiporter-2